MKVFMISDTHFGDERILRYENRPFSSVEEMDKAIIENWNQVVGEEDTEHHAAKHFDAGYQCMIRNETRKFSRHCMEKRF